MHLISTPNIVGALAPAVSASFKDAVPAFRPINKPWPTQKSSTEIDMQCIHFCFACAFQELAQCAFS
jgi:hypothetical protein